MLTKICMKYWRIETKIGEEARWTSQISQMEQGEDSASS
jgi:hypothetical protein